VVKYRHITIARFKHDLRPTKNHPIKNTTHTHKTQYRQNLRHYRAYQNEKQHTNRNTKPKTPTENHQKRHTTPENKNGIQDTHPQKEKASQSEKNALQDKKKSR
jgi:hypothetical protein